MPTSQDRTPEASQIVATIENSRVEMGGNQNALHSWITITP
jgi:hypothetical protein